MIALRYAVAGFILRHLRIEFLDRLALGLLRHFVWK